jgi:hypothetical protein
MFVASSGDIKQRGPTGGPRAASGPRLQVTRQAKLFVNLSLVTMALRTSAKHAIGFKTLQSDGSLRDKNNLTYKLQQEQI